MIKFLEIFKVARPGFWPTHVWFYLLPFAKQDIFNSFPFWLGCVYVCFPLGLFLYGWNDIGDAGTDRLNERKGNWLFGAKPDAALRKRLPWIIAMVQLPFLIAFVWIAGWKMLAWFLAVILANATYNSLGFKRLAFLDLANQVGYLLIFVLASWLCSVKQLNAPAMIFSALFAMHSHLFGQIIDVEEDAIDGRRTTAVTLGVRLSKFLLAGLLLTEALIAHQNFRSSMIAMLLVGGGVIFIADAMVGPKKYPLAFVTLFFIGWNGVVLSTMYFVWRQGLFLLI